MDPARVGRPPLFVRPYRSSVGVTPHDDAPGLTARVNGILNRWPAVGLAVGVVRDGKLWSSSTGTVSRTSRPATPVTEDTVFRIASVTKTFTAIAVMQLWEQGLVDLDAPADDYLRAYRLVPAKARLPAADRSATC